MSLFKWIIILMAINILLFVGGVRVIDDANYNFMGFFVNTAQLDATNQTTLNESFTSTLPTKFTESGGGALFTFIDSLKSVVAFVIFIVNIVFTPFGIFLAAGLPWQIGIMIGLPLIVAGVVAVALFIRGISG